MQLSDEELFKQAKRYIPGGVNSPVRAFKSVQGTPVFIDHAQNAYVYDASGKRYIDYVGSWGPMILGHAHPKVIAAVQETAAKGLSFGAPTALETDLAQLVCTHMPSIEKIRFVNSGTEATMSALRLARAFTERDKVIKFAGCYHGHVDGLLVKAGSGALTFGVPTSPGITEAVAGQTIVLPYNDVHAVEQMLKNSGQEIAAIIIEPVAGNMNCILPQPAFLERLRSLCDAHGVLLIFDEVMTGFRVALGGAQALYRIRPDLTTLGKIIGGGMPVGAFGGRADIMNMLAPDGPVYQAGTLSGNPVAMAAGIATLNEIARPGFYWELENKIQKLSHGLRDAATKQGVDLLIQHAGAMFGLFFTSAKLVANLDQVMQCDAKRFNKFFHAMLDRGIYFAPSAFEAGFISKAHSDVDIEETIAAAQEALS